MTEITIRITGNKEKEAIDAFMGWFLDGGGDQGFETTLDDGGLNVTEADFFMDTRLITYQID